jgi:hypothetical protein
MQGRIQFLNTKKPTYPVPLSQEAKLKPKIERFVSYGVLQKVNRSEWASPMFTVVKKDQTLRSIAALREVNKRIRQKPYPIPRIQELLHKLKGFQHLTSLDLNMGYYHITRLMPNASAICTVILPWGKYEYFRLPMGLWNSPDIFPKCWTNMRTQTMRTQGTENRTRGTENPDALIRLHIEYD